MHELPKTLTLLLLTVVGVAGQTPTGNATGVPFKSQPIQQPQSCLPCHQRQYNELRQSVKSGYRNVSPLFNGLETSANYITGGLLRPVYSDSTKLDTNGQPLNTNMFTSSPIQDGLQLRAGFCFTCHNANYERLANDPTQREVPEVVTGAASAVGGGFRPDLFRPLRDYHMVDSTGAQVIPAAIGAYPPNGALPSKGTAGISCDFCHNVGGPDLTRSFQKDGFANTSLIINSSIEKVGPFPFPVNVKNQFHVSSNDQSKISLIKSSAFCNSCHDVRLPGGGPGDLQHNEVNANAPSLPYFRLENLSTEWQTGAYNSTNNPFGKVTTCQDCHMSLFPYGGTSTYTVGPVQVTSATPAVYAQNYAAVPGVSTDENYPLPKRTVVDHHFTGTDVPIMSATELQARLGPDYPDPYQPGVDEYGNPMALATRRQNLL